MSAVQLTQAMLWRILDGDAQVKGDLRGPSAKRSFVIYDSLHLAPCGPRSLRVEYVRQGRCLASQTVEVSPTDNGPLTLKLPSEGVIEVIWEGLCPT